MVDAQALQAARSRDGGYDEIKEMALRIGVPEARIHEAIAAVGDDRVDIKNWLSRHRS